jgi:hypothetical protein
MICTKLVLYKNSEDKFSFKENEVILSPVFKDFGPKVLPKMAYVTYIDNSAPVSYYKAMLIGAVIKRKRECRRELNDDIEELTSLIEV